jgi:hypothetical protein
MGVVTVPIDYTIDTERQLVRTRAWGVVTVKEWLAYIDRLKADTDFLPSFDQLADFTEVTELAIPLGADAQIVAASAFSKDSRRAAATSTDFVFGMARMYQGNLPDGDGIKILRSFSEAEEWLGI